MKIGIIADTATDTAMGKAYFEKAGFDVVCRPVKENSVACFKFFQEPKEDRDAYIITLIEEVKKEGAEAIAVYANSVCGYVDFSEMAALTKTKIITPFDAYGEIARKYSKPSVWAVTAAALFGIETKMLQMNPDVEICGIYKLGIAVLIEQGYSPAEVVQKAALKDLLKFCEGAGSEVIVLGCTHFPYLKKELEKYATIDIIDPADIMLKMLTDEK